jgi:hypothetical protein
MVQPPTAPPLLAEFTSDLRPTSGHSNVVADALSRPPATTKNSSAAVIKEPVVAKPPFVLHASVETAQPVPPADLWASIAPATQLPSRPPPQQWTSPPSPPLNPRVLMSPLWATHPHSGLSPRLTAVHSYSATSPQERSVHLFRPLSGPPSSAPYTTCITRE